MNPTMERLRKITAQLSRWCTDDWEAKVVALVLSVLVWWGVKTLIANDMREKSRVPSGFEMKTAGKEVPAP